MDTEHVLEVVTPLGFTVRCTRRYWEFIVTHKHPVLRGHEVEVSQVLADPDEVRRSRKDPTVFLFYRGSVPRWLCAVTKRTSMGTRCGSGSRPCLQGRSPRAVWR